MDQPASKAPHLLHVFSTFAVGGPQMRFVSLVNALGGKFQHTVLAMDGNMGAGAGVSKEVHCSYLRMPVVKTSGISIANVRCARALVRELGPDLLVTYNWGTIEWALADWPFPMCPHIHVEDGFGPEESSQHQNPRRVLARRFLLRHCAAVVVPSRTLYDLALGRWKLPYNRVTYLPNGIDCPRFAQNPDTDLLRSLGLQPQELIVGTVTALRPEKNLLRLVRLFAKLPRSLDAKLVIAGDGPERSRIEGAAEELGIARRVVLVGAISRPETLLKRFDIFALTSDTEQMPNTILEAMAAARAIVSTNVGDVKNMVAPENRSFIFDLDDEDHFSNALHNLLVQPELRECIGRGNLAQVTATYGLEKMVNRYESLFTAFKA